MRFLGANASRPHRRIGQLTLGNPASLSECIIAGIDFRFSKASMAC